MAPLPSTAMRYVTTSGRSYNVTRVNPINQTYNGSTNDDGLFDATYYFTVPLSNRSGTIIISTFRTMGVEYQGFVGVSTAPLIIGGPTSFALAFPKDLTVMSSAPTTTPTSASSTGHTFASLTNTFATIVAAIIVGLYFQRRRRKKQPSA